MLKEFSKASVKKFFLGLLISISFLSVAEAKNLPTVSWSHNVYTMSISDDQRNAQKRRGYQLLNAGTSEDQQQNRDKIAQAIADKLKEQKAKLPFVWKDSFDPANLSERNFEQNDETLGDKPLALVPMIITDYSIEKTYVINNQTYHKYIIVSAIDIAFCTEDENGALTILTNIPLHFYTSIPTNSSINAMTQKSTAELARIYADFTAKMIREHLDFTKYNRILKKLEDRKFSTETGSSDTYRVESVSYSSDRARSVLGMNTLMQRIAGNIFTSDFSAYTGNIVYPMAGDGSNWTVDATREFYITKMMTSYSGDEKEVRMPAKVDHAIILDVSGAASMDIETKNKSDINGFKMYRIWMTSTIKGATKLKQPIEITNDTVEEYLKGNSAANKIIKDEQEIFGELMIGAAVNSAAAQAGKKVKK